MMKKNEPEKLKAESSKLKAGKVCHASTVPTRLLNTPLMVTTDEVNVMLDVLNSGAFDMAAMFQSDEAENTANESGIAIIPVIGGLTYRGYGWFWNTTYGQIRKDFREALADPQIKAIVFDIDSPGGEVAGVFDLVDEIYAARGQKPIDAIVNERGYSAAYAIASSTDKVYLSRTAGVGSIGVIAIHADQSKWDERIGVKYTPIFAGDRKNDFSPHEPLTDKVKGIAQKSVDKANDLFLETVARNRGISVEAVRNMQAAFFEGNDAVQAGLADAVLSWDEVIEKIKSKIEKGGNLMNTNELKTGLEVLIVDDSKKAEVTAVLAGLGFVPKAEAGPSPAEGAVDVEKIKTEAKKEGRKEAMEKTKGIMDLCALAGMPQMASALIEKKASVEDARKEVLAAKADQSGDDEINSTVGAISTGEVNPLLADAQNRAKKAGKEV